MKNCILSVIIPLYQKAYYIQECIDSLYAQGISEEMFEVIIVDDGSTDGGGKIVDDIMREHSNLRVFHKPHKSAGAARNTGLRAARGEYIHFVDADDLLFPGAYVQLFSLIQEKKTDIVQFRLVREGEKQQSYQEKCIEYEGSIRGYIRNKGVRVSSCNKWFRKEFLTMHHVAFPLYSYSEDTAFTWSVLRYEGSLLVTNIPVYYYRVGENSIERNREVKVVKETIMDLIATNLQLRNVASNYIDCPAVKDIFLHKYHVLFNRILCTPYCYRELKDVFSQCAKIGVSHLHGRGISLWVVNFLYHHPLIYYVCHPMILRLYFHRTSAGKGGTDFIGSRLNNEKHRF